MEIQMASQQTVVESNSPIDQISCLIKARVPIIYVVTHEETRFIDALKTLAPQKEINRELWVWSSCMGLLQDFTKNVVTVAKGQEEKTENPKRALERIHAHEIKPSTKGNIYIMRDMHKVLTNDIPRMMRDMYEHLVHNSKTIIIVAPYLGYGAGGSSRGVEPTLEKQVTVVNFNLPTKEELQKIVKNIMSTMKSNKKNVEKVQTNYTDEDCIDFTRACQGLTHQEADNVIMTSLVKLGKIDVNHILQEKKNIIRKSDILEYIDSDVQVSDIGGMDEAKKFFASYQDCFSDEAKEYGVEPLRGVLLVGIPGGGKSHLAKAMAHQFKLPLLRLDIGKVMGSLVGQSEARMREAISTAESVAPCLLWADEIEKGISGTSSSGQTDGGTLSRVFGTLLTAMQEGLKDVTIIATANQISQLPPEFIRRFNEVFFVDLPTEEERGDIFSIHLKKRKRDPANFNMTDLLKNSDEFTGAEIEKAIKDSLALAWSNNKQPLETSHIVTALKATRPISKVMGESISSIREWAKDRARYASSGAAKLAAPGNQKITTTNGKQYDLKDSLDDLSDVVKTDKEIVKQASDLEEEKDRFNNI